MNILKILKKIIFKKDKIKAFQYACRNCLKSPGLYPVGNYSGFDVDLCAENYIKNLEAARYFTNLSGARYLNFLQPFCGSGKRALSKFDQEALRHMARRVTIKGNNELDLITSFYNSVWQKAQDKDYVFDLRSIFDDYNGEIYFDQTHCSDIGYDIIAKEIASRIIELEGLKEGKG